MIKNERGINLIILIIVIAIIIVVGIFIKNFFTNNDIENIVLSEENLYETLEEYSKLKKNSDDVSYAVYAVYSNENSSEEAYSSIYGKTLKQLVKEGKDLMKKDNITPKEFRKKIENEFT